MTMKEKPLLSSSSSGVKTYTLKVKALALFLSPFSQLTHHAYSFYILLDRNPQSHANTASLCARQKCRKWKTITSPSSSELHPKETLSYNIRYLLKHFVSVEPYQQGSQIYLAQQGNLTVRRLLRRESQNSAEFVTTLEKRKFHLSLQICNQKHTTSRI